MSSSNSDKSLQITNWIKEALAPPSLLNPWQWAEKFINLTARTGTARPGRYSTEITPHVREVMEEFINPKTRMISLCFGAQSGKTQTELNLVGYVIENCPGPTMFIAPNQEFARTSISEKRLQPLIEDNKVLARHKLSNSDKFKLQDMSLDNMDIYMRWAGSPTAISSIAVKYMFNDEVDKWKSATEKEADPMFLARERTKTFADHKIMNSSTPTIEEGNIWKLLNKGDFRKFELPCPCCGEYFFLEWKMIKWSGKSDNEIVESTHLECPHCAGRIQEKYKREMLNNGRWVKTNPNPDIGHVSFHISELYSLFTKWTDLALKFVYAKRTAKTGDFTELQNFVNSSLGEPWLSPISAVAKESDYLPLIEERPEGRVPMDGVRMLTAGCDTQDNGFFFVIRAWGDNYESWLVRNGFVPTFEALGQVLFDDKYKDSIEREYIVGLSFIDAMGHRTAEVYDFCRTWGRISPTKGERTMNAPYKNTRIEFYPGTDRAIPGGVDLIRLNTKHYKDLIIGKKSIAPTDPGAFHLHNGIEEGCDYLKHMTAEYRDEKGIWVCPPHRANHFFDCEVGCIAAAYYAGVEYMTGYYDREVQPRPKKNQVVQSNENLQKGVKSKRRFW